MSTPHQPLRMRGRSESGASLIMALAIMLAMGVVVAALGTYAQTNHKATLTYRGIREKRYAGQSAVAQLVNWARDNPAVGRDPDLPIDHPDCITQVTQRIMNQDRVVTASCLAEEGSGSGQPADTGLTPPEGLVLLGTRQNQPGPYNAPPCTGWWDDISNFFVNLVTYDNILQENDTLDIIRETSFRLKNRTATGVLGATCSARDRGVRSPFKVSSDIAAAGDMWSNGYPVAAVDPDGDGPATAELIARGICNFQGCIQGAAADAAQYERSGLTGAESYLNGSKPYQDPGRRWPKHPQPNPFGDIAEPWTSVAFNQDGTVRPLPEGEATGIMPSRLPVRTSAYLRDPINGDITALSPNTCPSSSATIVFLPGWYKSSKLLNDFTANPACADATLWFAPDPGPDGFLLTDDDRTGGFYFDFREGAAENCNGLGALRARWCVGGSRTNPNGFAAQSPRIVVGTPDGWTPRSTLGNGEVDPNTTFRVEMNRANTIDLDLSQSWSNGGAAATIDGNAAAYSASVCVPFINWCFAIDRAIRVRNFAPKVSGAPVELPGAPRGRIYVQVAYAVRNATSADPARAIIEAVSPESGRKQCGTFSLISDRTQTETGPSFEPSDLKTYTFTDAQAKQLADNCGSVDLINGLEVKIEVRGNNLNLPKTGWFLDGVKIYYDSYDGAQFPAPTDDDNPAAQRDCDPAKPGGQFIFGGDSHMYVADGSVEICAGPYPDAPNVDTKQSIGVWALPAVGEIAPIGSWAGPGVSSLAGSGNVVDIDRSDVRINYGACPLFGGNGCDGITRVARLDVRMNAYTAPPGYLIDRVTTRFAYNARTSCPPIFNVFCARPEYQIGTCAKLGANKINGTLQFANIYPQLLAYDATTGRNCIGVSEDRKSFGEGYFYYFARCAAWCVGGNYDNFDGVRYQVHLVPETTSAARLIPQSGCIVAWPNYGYGGGNPDCALIRADLTRNNDGWTLPWAQKESGDSRGRISVKGTVYAPSSAVEVDDTDSAYPLATRGAVLRHLRIAGFRFREDYDAPAIDNRVDRSAARREMVMTACLQSDARRADREPCDAEEDEILTRARVAFEVDASDADGDGTPDVAPERRARVPQIIAWTDQL